jgi:nucleotide-binding universal stress UspA family protein
MEGPAFSRLLLATEHSEYDVGAEAVAFELARHCALPLAAVLPIVYTTELEAQTPALAARADAQAAARREALRAAAASAGVRLDLNVRHGPEPYAEIIDEARARSADLIVIRRRGRRGLLANLLLGEMVHKVVAHAPCSVLVVPRAAPMWHRHVLVGVDPASTNLRPAIDAARVARSCGLPLTIAAVTGDAATADAAARTLASAVQAAHAAGVEAEALQLPGKVHEQLIDAANRRGADLIVVGRRGETKLARAWIGGITQKIVGLAQGPVLVSIESAGPPS